MIEKPILNLKCFDMSDFEQFFALKNHVLFHFTPENDLFYIFCAVKGMILNWRFLYGSDFELKKKQRVRFLNNLFTTDQFWFEKFTTRQNLNKNFYNVLDFKLTTFQLIQSQSLTQSHHMYFDIVFFHITLCSYSLQYLRQLDNSNCHRPNNISCTRFRKDLDFWFCYDVPLYSLYGFHICRNLLLPVK